MPTRLASPALIGSGLAAASLPVHVVLARAASVELAALTLAAVGAVYAGFGLQRGTLRQAAAEVAVALAFAAAALAGLWVSAWAIPGAFAAHAAWDLAHHRHGQPAPTARASLVAVPSWYPPFCAVYDVVFAAGLATAWLR